MLNWEKSKGEISFRPSKTIPDQAMTIEEIMRKYASGQPLNGVKVPVYEGEDSDMPDPATMDLVDRQEYAEAARSEIKRINDQRQATLRSKQSAPAAPESTNENKPATPPQYPLNYPPAEQAPGRAPGGNQSTNNP